MTAIAPKIPVTIITGFLGSGKTTLLDYILSDTNHKKRIAVIENEYATPIGVDNELKSDLSSAVFVAEIKETASGCLCCAGRGDFLGILKTLVDNRTRFDYIVIETDGLTDPSFMKVFYDIPYLKDTLALDGVVTLVDAKHLLNSLKKPTSPNELNEAYEQIAVADRILINKIDLVQPQEVSDLEKRIRGINPYADVVRTEFAKVPLDRVLDIKAFDLQRVLQQHDPKFGEFRPERNHDPRVSALTMLAKAPLQLEAVKTWLNQMLEKHDFMRFKGVLNLDKDDTRYSLQGVHNTFQFAPHKLWDADAEQRFSRFVFIGKDLPRAHLLQSFKEQTGVVVVDEDAMRARAQGPPMFETLALLVLTFAVLMPDELDRVLRRLPLYERTHQIVAYRWWLLAALLALYMIATRTRRASPAP